MKYVPNLITTIRLLLVPVFSYYLYEEQFLIAGIVFAAAALSDVIDGYIARKYKVISNFGKLADPVADKLMQVSAITVLYLIGKLHFAFILILVVKELLMIIGSAILYKKKFVVQSFWFGKLAAVILNLSIGITIIFNLSQSTVNLLIGISMGATVVALVLYTKRFFEINKNLQVKN